MRRNRKISRNIGKQSNRGGGGWVGGWWVTCNGVGRLPVRCDRRPGLHRKPEIVVCIYKKWLKKFLSFTEDLRGLYRHDDDDDDDRIDRARGGFQQPSSSSSPSPPRAARRKPPFLGMIWFSNKQRALYYGRNGGGGGSTRRWAANNLAKQPNTHQYIRAVRT